MRFHVLFALLLGALAFPAAAITVTSAYDGSFAVTGPANDFTAWATAGGGVVNNGFSTNCTAQTGNVWMSGTLGSNTWANFTIPFTFARPLKDARLDYGAICNSYGNNWGRVRLSIIAGGTTTVIFNGVGDSADACYNYTASQTPPKPMGSWRGYTDITNLVKDQTAFSLLIEVNTGWESWVYNGGQFLPQYWTDSDFHLTGHTSREQNWTSPFGLVCSWPGVENLGLGWIRGGAGATSLGSWGTIEAQNNTFTWDQADNEAQGYFVNGQSPLPILAYTPLWASPDGQETTPPADLADYADFVKTTVDHYRYDIGAWELWNEQNDNVFFNGNINQYTDLLKTGYTAAKRANPHAVVLFGGTAGVDTDFLAGVYERGGKDYFDVMACHPYQWDGVLNDGWFIDKLTNLRNTMNANGDTFKEIWLTEFGWSTGSVSEAQQAELLAQTVVTVLSLKPMGVTHGFWYNVKDWGSPGFGLLRDDGTTKPAFQAYQTVISLLDEATYKGDLTLATGVRCYVFDPGDGTATLAIWAPQATAITLTDALVGTNAQFQNHLGTALPANHDQTGYHQTATTSMLYVTNVSTGVFTSAVLPTRPAFTPGSGSIPAPGPVWASIVAPEHTDRPVLVAGLSAPLQVYLLNQGETTASGSITAAVSGVPTPPAQNYTLAPGQSTTLTFTFTVPSTSSGLLAATVTGTANGSAIHNAIAQVRIVAIRPASGLAIEFAGHSHTELQYLYDAGDSACAESVRFGSNFTYRVDLTGVTHATLATVCGANAAGPWAVKVSRDRASWTTLASGNSWPDTRTLTLDAYTGGPLYIKYEGVSVMLKYFALTAY